MDLETHVKDWNTQAFGPSGTCLDCEEVRIDVSRYSAAQKIVAEYLKNGEWTSFFTDEKFEIPRGIFKEAKLAAYVKGRGTWIFLRVVLRPDAAPTVEELFDREIVGSGPLEHPASAAQLVGELAVFPRTRENIPDWMIQTIEAAGEPVPVLDPETDMVVMGDESWPYEEPSL